MSSSAEVDELDLGDQMLQLDRHTIDDGRARGRVKGVDDQGNNIDVEIEVLTTREVITVSFEKPDTWSRTFRWVRFVEWCGYNAASSLQVVGEEVPLRSTDDGWKIDTERLPGESLFDESDYYSGVVRGAGLSAIYLVSLPIIATVGGFLEISLTFSGGLLSAAGMAVTAIAWLIICWGLVRRLPDDNKETISWAEASAGDVREVDHDS